MYIYAKVCISCVKLNFKLVSGEKRYAKLKQVVFFPYNSAKNTLEDMRFKIQRQYFILKTVVSFIVQKGVTITI